MRRFHWKMLSIGLVTVWFAWGCSGDLLDDDPPAVEKEWQASDETADDGGDRDEREEESSEPLDTDDLPGAEPSNLPGSVSSDIPGDEMDVPSFVAHEWGTFTSVVASNGDYLPGLHHEGVALPAFVHDLAFSGPGGGRNPDRRGPRLPEQVTQKLETPVIYFYSDKPRDISVQVKFPKGYITKWYPDATEMWPKDPGCRMCDGFDREAHGFDKLEDGRMTWKASITHEDESDAMVDVPPDDIWAPSRRVPKAAFVQHSGETDKFIFYRGVGKATPPIRISSSKTSDGPKFSFANQSPQQIPNIYVMDISENTGRITKVGSLSGDAKAATKMSSEEMEKEAFVKKAKRMVKRGLVDTGLTAAEADAMVETWAHSYFRKTGYRVLYVLPRTWTDRMLPIDIEPTPDKLVRTLVGRVEVMTPTVEQETLDRIRRAKAQNRRLEDVYRGGRFEEPHFRRACQLAQNADLKTWCKKQLAKLSAEVISENGRSGY